MRMTQPTPRQKIGSPLWRWGVGVTLTVCVVLCMASASYGGEVVEEPDGSTVVRVTLPYFLLPSPASQDPYKRAMVHVNKAFVDHYQKVFSERLRDAYKANPERYGKRDWSNVRVELEPFSGIRVEGVESDLLGIAGGMSPDVIMLNFRKSGTYIDNGFLYPLDKTEDGYLSGKHQDELDFRIYHKLWPVIKRKGPAGQTQVWAMPQGSVGARVLLYRKDLFDEAGLAYPTAQWTWDDLLATCKRMTDPKRGRYGMTLVAGKHESWGWMSFLWSAGGDAMVYDAETDQWRCVFDSPEATTALDFYVTLATERWTDDEGRVQRGYAYQGTGYDNGARWERGDIAMEFGTIGDQVFSKINPELVGMAPLPLGPTGVRGGEFNAGLLGLFAGIEDPVIRDAAWEYLWFLNSKEAMAIKVRQVVDGGLGQFVNPEYLRMFGYDDIISLAPKGWSDIFKIAIETGKPEPYGRNSNVAYDIMTVPLQQATQLSLSDELPTDHNERMAVLNDLLKKAVERGNEEIIGVVTPSERRKRNITAAVVLLAIVVGFAWVFRRIFKAFTPEKIVTPNAQVKRSRGLRRSVWVWVLLAPAVLSIFCWSYVPLMLGSLMAFQDYRVMGGSRWVWLQNFGDVIYDGVWWRSIYDALRYSFMVVTLTFIPPIVLAILLQEVQRGTLLFRTIYYLPAVISGLVMVVLWKQFYDPSADGVLNMLVLALPAWAFLGVAAAIALVPLALARRLFTHELYTGGVLLVVAALLLLLLGWSLAEPILVRHGETIGQAIPHVFSRLFTRTPEAYRWLGDPGTAMLSCVIPMVWAGMGPGCLIYLAALKGIPDDYYEAAGIDGATFLDKILFIIFPMLKPLIIINFVGAFIGSWYGATSNILVMTGGAAHTEVAGLYIFYKAFLFLQFGPATAAAWILAFMLIGFTVYQLRILSRLEFRAASQDKKS